MINRAIPKYSFELPDVEYSISDEKLVELRENNIIFAPMYFLQGILCAVDKCYMRESVAEKIINVSKKLPDGMKLKIFDAWRPFEVQLCLYNDYRKQVALAHKSATEDEIDILTQQFVSLPKKDARLAPVHSTGGAVDLTIVTHNGTELDMGTSFDDFTERASTTYFEKSGRNICVRDNRRLLYNLMINEGFTNLPTEWWHFDYGDKFWAHYKKEKAIYQGVFEI
ncbi:MAG: M15 family metallopeptidase [Clostridia bacterium]|nr:M15 family metallopeptidase [Clostridia bacterium]